MPSSNAERAAPGDSGHGSQGDRTGNKPLLVSETQTQGQCQPMRQAVPPPARPRQSVPPPDTMAIETGIMSFEAVFLPYMLTDDGRPVCERVAELLPKPTEQKVIALAR